MNYFKSHAAWACFAVPVFIGLSALGSAYAEDSRLQRTARSQLAAPTPYSVHGVVEDRTPDLSLENLAPLEKAAAEGVDEKGSDHAFVQVIEKVCAREHPVPGAVVKISGGSITRNLVADANGQFTFEGLPGGTYELFAERAASSSGEKAAFVKTPEPQKVGVFGDKEEKVYVRGDLVSVKGRITDANGRPIVGATVRGEFYPPRREEDGIPLNYDAVSDANGFYEFSQLKPMGFMMAVGCLNHGGSHRPYYSEVPPHSYLIVHVEAKGYAQDKTKVPSVPLMTEPLLKFARRLQDLMLGIRDRLEKGGKPSEKKKVSLPAIRGDTISGIDVVLDPK